jgi:hypothetical protein
MTDDHLYLTILEDLAQGDRASALDRIRVLRRKLRDAPMDAAPPPEPAYVPPRGEVEILSNPIGQWYAYAGRSWPVFFDSTRGWVDCSQGDVSHYLTREACVSAVDAWYAKHAPAPVEQPEPPVEQPQSDGAASGAESEIRKLRLEICDVLASRQDAAKSTEARDAFWTAQEIVVKIFDVDFRHLVAFDRRDFELLAKHEIGLIPARIAKEFYVIEFSGSANEIRRIGVIHPDYLSALRAAIAEARRREGEVKS